ncbi:uncharacterized protein GJ701_014554 isoform 1-T1 [Geothlypis trichas]
MLKVISCCSHAGTGGREEGCRGVRPSGPSSDYRAQIQSAQTAPQRCFPLEGTVTLLQPSPGCDSGQIRRETPLPWLSVIPLSTSACQRKISIKFVRAIVFPQAGMCVRARDPPRRGSSSSGTCGSFRREGAGKSRQPAAWGRLECHGAGRRLCRSRSALEGVQEGWECLGCSLQAASKRPEPQSSRHSRDRRRRRAAGRKELGGDKVQCKRRAGAASRPHRAGATRARGQAGGSGAAARCFLHAGVRTNSCRFSELGARPGVLPGENLQLQKPQAAPGALLLCRAGGFGCSCSPEQALPWAEGLWAHAAPCHRASSPAPSAGHCPGHGLHLQPWRNLEPPPCSEPG